MDSSTVYPDQRWIQAVNDDEENASKNLFSAITTNVLLFFLIFGLSATVEVKNLKHQLTNRSAIFTGVAMQFIIMPLLGFLSIFMLRKADGFSQAMGITLLVVTASPGGSFSNWWCSVFNAELALSVAMTSVSSVLSVALLPANLFLYSWLADKVVMPSPSGETVDIVDSLDFSSIFITLGVVMGGILVGLYFGFVFNHPKFHKRANSFGSFCGLLLILFSVFLGSGSGGANTNFWSLPWEFYVGTSFPCVVGMLLANIISRSLKLAATETVAISIECCYQNTAIAISVAATMFSDPTARTEAISVPLFYGILEALIIFLYGLWAWKVGWTKAPANEKFCVILTKTYELEDEEMEWSTDEGPKGWFANLFVPRAESETSRDRMTQLSTRIGNGKSARQSGLRPRVDSSDVTVATERSRLDSVDASLPVSPSGSSPFGSFDSKEDNNDIEGQVNRLEPLSEEMRGSSEASALELSEP